MSKHISRREAKELPSFSSYTEARLYFDNLYGSDFILQDIEDSGGQLCYFHAIIIDRDNYSKGMQALADKKCLPDNLAFMMSYQPVQIMQDGSVHIVH